jgi:3-methyladenine DNA glycosylase AlkD
MIRLLVLPPDDQYLWLKSKYDKIKRELKASKDEKKQEQPEDNVIKVAKRFGIRNSAHNRHTWNGTFTEIAQDRTCIASTSFTLQNLWKALTMVQNPLVREKRINLFILLFLIAITTWGLLWCSLHVLSLHSSRSSPTKWAREGKINVLLAINPDHEWWNVHDLLANPVEWKGITKERNEIKYNNQTIPEEAIPATHMRTCIDSKSRM